jgi:4,4'-diaponeurosporenoate glycosyltransferase
VLGAAFVFWLLGLALFWLVPLLGRKEEADPAVSVIIPARDEAANIGRLVESLRAQTQPPHEIIVVDDNSTDETAACATAAGATVFSAGELPEGWAGKSWACWQGASVAKGELLLFLDADTWLAPETLGRMHSTFREQPGLLSIQPYHEMRATYEKLGALFNLITMLGTGAFTVLGARLAPRIAFGACVLAEREVYMSVGGHRRAAGSVVEGAQLARAFSEAGHPVRCLGGRGSVSFRMYPEGHRSMIGGLAKSFATGAGSVPAWLLIPIVAWVVGGVTTSRNLLVGGLGPGDVPIAAWVLAVLYAGQMRWMLARIGNYGWWPAILFPIPTFYFLGVFFLSSFRTFVRRRVSWRGRSVPVR